MSGLSRLEQETVIVWNQQDGEALITTASPPVIRKLKKAGLTPCRVLGAHLQFRIEKRRVSLRLGPRRQKAPSAGPQKGRFASRTPAQMAVSGAGTENAGKEPRKDGSGVYGAEGARQPGPGLEVGEPAA